MYQHTHFYWRGFFYPSLDKYWFHGFLSFLLACVGALSAQYPSYAPPLAGPLLVTGTFGELRSNHFHAGLDFRASVGTPVFAVADGYVSRVVVSPGGYGQAIYIDHPEGYRSVYGHLSAFSPALLDTVRAYQYAEQSFGIQLRFDSTAFPIKRGQRIGEVGNRGHSFGPHLHFELRNSVTDAPLNPLHFGIQVADKRKPQVRKIKLYELDAATNSFREQAVELRLDKAGIYRPQLAVLEVFSPRIGLGVKAYDQQDALPNYNGIYAARLELQDSLLHAFRYDSLPFEETRYLNAHTDYADWLTNKSWYYRLFRLPGDQLSVYEAPPAALLPRLGREESRPEAGVLLLAADEKQEIRIKISDWAGNSSQIVLTLVYRPGRAAPSSEGYQYFLPRAEAHIIERPDFYFSLPPGALYTDCYMRYQAVFDPDPALLSPVHHLHDAAWPLHMAAQLRLSPHSPIPSHWKDKVVLASCPKDSNTKATSYGPAYDEAGVLQALPIRSFGDYVLMLDTIPPTISLLSLPSVKNKRAAIRIKIDDNFSNSGESRSLRYRATLNGQWFLLEDDRKKQELFYEFQQPLPAGRYVLQLQVKDDRNNETTQVFEWGW